MTTIAPAAAHIQKQVPLSVEALLGGAADGDRGAFAEIHRRLAPRVFSTITLLVPLRHDAHRITDEVFTQIWCTAGTFDSRTGTATPWIMTLAREHAFRHIRRRDRLNHS